MSSTSMTTALLQIREQSEFYSDFMAAVVAQVDDDDDEEDEEEEEDDGGWFPL
jgi:hypothetical protein